MSENMEGRLPLVNQQDVPMYYINSVQLAAGPYDFALTCGLMRPVPGSPVLQLFHLMMSPSHAKVLGKMLVDTVKEYEEKMNIVIPVPPIPEEVK